MIPALQQAREKAMALLALNVPSAHAAVSTAYEVGVNTALAEAETLLQSAPPQGYLGLDQPLPQKAGTVFALDTSAGETQFRIDELERLADDAVLIANGQPVSDRLAVSLANIAAILRALSRTSAGETPQELGPHPWCRRCKGTGECDNAQFRCPCRWSTSPYRADAEAAGAPTSPAPPPETPTQTVYRVFDEFIQGPWLETKGEPPPMLTAFRDGVITAFREPLTSPLETPTIRPEAETVETDRRDATVFAEAVVGPDGTDEQRRLARSCFLAGVVHGSASAPPQGWQPLRDAAERLLHRLYGFNERTQTIWCSVCKYRDPLVDGTKLHADDCPLLAFHTAFDALPAPPASSREETDHEPATFSLIR